MRNLAALQATPAGRAFLAQEMTFDDPAVFLDQLRPPRLGSGGELPPAQDLPVYVHQQLYLDYRASVVAKLLALRALQAQQPAVQPTMLWIDSDRAGSDKLSLRLYLRGAQGAIAVRLAPAGCEQREPRFIPLDPARLAAGVQRLAAVIGAQPGGGGARLARFAKLRPLLTADGSLADFGRRLSDTLFAEILDFRPRPLHSSALITTGALTPALTELLNQQPAFVASVNARIAALWALDVDARIRPLPADYLPLFIASPLDGRRLRLRLERDGPLRLATAVDAAGRRHRYELGRTELSLAQLDGQVHWSPDVTLPLLVNDRFSGLVAGRSSALYLLAFRPALRSLLRQEPLPVLVPRSWDVFAGAFDSLFDAYLDDRRL